MQIIISILLVFSLLHHSLSPHDHFQHEKCIFMQDLEEGECKKRFELETSVVSHAVGQVDNICIFCSQAC